MKKVLKELFEDDKTRTASLGKVLCTFIVIICAAPAVRAVLAGAPMPDIPLQWAGAAVTFYLGQKTISNFSSSETATRGGGNESQ